MGLLFLFVFFLLLLSLFIYFSHSHWYMRHGLCVWSIVIALVEWLGYRSVCILHNAMRCGHNNAAQQHRYWRCSISGALSVCVPFFCCFRAFSVGFCHTKIHKYIIIHMSVVGREVGSRGGGGGRDGKPISNSIKTNRKRFVFLGWA